MTNRTRFTAELMTLAILGGVIWAKAAPSSAQKPAEVVRTQRLEITDSKGKQRAVFATQPDGDPILTLLDNKENPILNLAIVDKGKTVALTFGKSPGTSDGIILGITEDGTKMFVMDHKKAKVIVGIDKDGAPGVEVHDKNGKSKSISLD